MRVSTSFLTTTAAALLLAFTVPGAHAIDAKDAKNLTNVAYIYTYPIMLTYKQMYTVRVCVCVCLRVCIYDLKRWPGYLFLPLPLPFTHPKIHTHTHTHIPQKNKQDIISKGQAFNTFYIQEKLPDFKTAAPNANVDFLAATAWIDTRDHPIVLTVPEPDRPDRYVCVCVWIFMSEGEMGGRKKGASSD